MENSKKILKIQKSYYFLFQEKNVLRLTKCIPLWSFIGFFQLTATQRCCGYIRIYKFVSVQFLRPLFTRNVTKLRFRFFLLADNKATGTQRGVKFAIDFMPPYTRNDGFCTI